MPSPCSPHSNHCSSSSYVNLLASSGRLPEMPCLGAFSAWGQAWPVSGLPTWDQRHIRLGTHSHSDPQGRQGPEGPTVAAQAGQTMSPPHPPGLGPRAVSPHAGPSSASDPDRGTPKMKTRIQTAPSTPPDAFQRGESMPVQRAALVSSNKGSLGEVGACGIDGAQGIHQKGCFGDREEAGF